jgi:hypothetical protein
VVHAFAPGISEAHINPGAHHHETSRPRETERTALVPQVSRQGDSQVASRRVAADNNVPLWHPLVVDEVVVCGNSIEKRKRPRRGGCQAVVDGQDVVDGRVFDEGFRDVGGGVALSGGPAQVAAAMKVQSDGLAGTTRARPCGSDQGDMATHHLWGGSSSQYTKTP